MRLACLRAYTESTRLNKRGDFTHLICLHAWLGCNVMYSSNGKSRVQRTATACSVQLKRIANVSEGSADQVWRHPTLQQALCMSNHQQQGCITLICMHPKMHEHSLGLLLDSTTDAHAAFKQQLTSRDGHHTVPASQQKSFQAF